MEPSLECATPASTGRIGSWPGGHRDRVQCPPNQHNSLAVPSCSPRKTGLLEAHHGRRMSFLPGVCPEKCTSFGIGSMSFLGMHHPQSEEFLKMECFEEGHSSKCSFKWAQHTVLRMRNTPFGVMHRFEGFLKRELLKLSNWSGSRSSKWAVAENLGWVIANLSPNNLASMPTSDNYIYICIYLLYLDCQILRTRLASMIPWLLRRVFRFRGSSFSGSAFISP